MTILGIDPANKQLNWPKGSPYRLQLKFSDGASGFYDLTGWVLRFAAFQRGGAVVHDEAFEIAGDTATILFPGDITALAGFNGARWQVAQIFEEGPTPLFRGSIAVSPAASDQGPGAGGPPSDLLTWAPATQTLLVSSIGPRGPSFSEELNTTPEALLAEHVEQPVAAAVATVPPVLDAARADVGDLITATGEAFGQEKAALDDHVATKTAEIDGAIATVEPVLTAARSDVAGFLADAQAQIDDFPKAPLQLLGPDGTLQDGPALEAKFSAGPIQLFDWVKPDTGLDMAPAINSFLAAVDAYRPHGAPRTVEAKGKYRYLLGASLNCRYNDMTLDLGGELTFEVLFNGVGVFIARGDRMIIRGFKAVFAGVRAGIGDPFYGYSGFQQMCAVFSTGSDCTFEDISVFNMFNAICMRGPTLNAADGTYLGPTGARGAFDYVTPAKRNIVRNIKAESSDFAITGHQQEDLVIEGLTQLNVTNTIPGVPAHAIYMTNPGANAAADRAMKRVRLSRLRCSNSRYVAYKFRYAEDITIEQFDADNVGGALLMQGVVRATINPGQVTRLTQNPGGDDDTITGERWAMYLIDCAGAMVNGGVITAVPNSLTGGIICRGTTTVRITGTIVNDNMSADTTVCPFRAEDSSIMELLNVRQVSTGVSVPLARSNGTAKVIVNTPTKIGGDGRILATSSPVAGHLSLDTRYIENFTGRGNVASAVTSGVLPTFTDVASGYNGATPFRGDTDISSATVTNIGTTGFSATNRWRVTGAVIITSFGSPPGNDQMRWLRFTSTPTLVHSATLICPGAANIVVAPGDTCQVNHEGAGVWRIVWYQRAAKAP